MSSQLEVFLRIPQKFLEFSAKPDVPVRCKVGAFRVGGGMVEYALGFCEYGLSGICFAATWHLYYGALAVSLFLVQVAQSFLVGEIELKLPKPHVFKRL